MSISSLLELVFDRFSTFFKRDGDLGELFLLKAEAAEEGEGAFE